jgi:hypothetical protein
LDHDVRSSDHEDYTPTLEHELVHVLETVLTGRGATIEPMVDTWFSEGLAEAMVDVGSRSAAIAAPLSGVSLGFPRLQR